MLNLSVLLEDSARRHAEPRCGRAGRHPARPTPDSTPPPTRSRTCSSSRGIRPGDKVALSCPNLPYFPIVYYGILKAGAVVVPLNVLLRGARSPTTSRTRTRRRTSASRAPPSCRWARRAGPVSSRPTAASTSSSSPPTPARRLADRGRRDAGRGAGRPALDLRDRRTDADDTAVILYTSGHDRPAEGRRAVARQPAAATRSRATGTFGAARHHDVHLITLPLFHSFGPTVQMNAGFAVGAHAGAAAAVRRRAAAARAAGGASPSSPACRRCTGGCSAPSRIGVDVDRIAANLRIAVSGGAACRWRSSGSSRSASACRSSRATDSRRPRRSRPSRRSARRQCDSPPIELP